MYFSSSSPKKQTLHYQQQQRPVTAGATTTLLLASSSSSRISGRSTQQERPPSLIPKLLPHQNTKTSKKKSPATPTITDNDDKTKSQLPQPSQQQRPSTAPAPTIKTKRAVTAPAHLPNSVNTSRPTSATPRGAGNIQKRVIEPATSIAARIQHEIQLQQQHLQQRQKTQQSRQDKQNHGSPSRGSGRTRGKITSTKKSKKVKDESGGINFVLPPRTFGTSSTSMFGTDDERENNEEEGGSLSGRFDQVDAEEERRKKMNVKIKQLHFSDSYTPHKAYWVKKALEKLGSGWIQDKKITVRELISEAFEEKIGVLYDLAMSRKHDAIDRLVDQVVMEDEIERQRRGDSEIEDEIVVQRNFPFASHLSEEVKGCMSESLLRIMIRESKEEDGDGSEQGMKNKKNLKKDVNNNMKKKKKKQESRPETAGDQDGGGGGEMDDSYKSSDLSRRKSNKGVQPCYVLDGGRLIVGTKKGLIGVGGSFINRFGGSWQSRARHCVTPCTVNNDCSSATVTVGTAVPGENDRYYRRIVNMMGFLPHEVRIRYCKENRQIIVNGSRPMREDKGENERQVREVIIIPKGFDIERLLVLRTGKGSLIFEEMDGEVHDWKSGGEETYTITSNRSKDKTATVKKKKKVNSKKEPVIT